MVLQNWGPHHFAGYLRPLGIEHFLSLMFY